MNTINNIKKEYRNQRRKDIEQRFVSEERVKEVVLDHFGLSMDRIVVKSRRREICYPRHVLIYLLSIHTVLSYKYIGEMFGGRDHTTAMHSKHTIKDLMDTNDNIFNEIQELTKKIFDMNVKVKSDEELVSIATEAIHILNNLLASNKDWDDNPGYDAKQAKRRWETTAENYLAKISGKEVVFRSTSVEITLTYENINNVEV